MQKAYEIIDELDMQSRAEKQTLQDYLDFLLELQEEIKNKIELVKNDIKRAK